MLQNQFRINDYILAELIDTNKIMEFGEYSDNGIHQYITDKDCDHTILLSENILNKTYNEPAKIRYSNLAKKEILSSKIRFYIKQHFAWKSSYFRLAIIVKDLSDESILLSRAINIPSEAKLGDNLLIDGMFWTSYIEFDIPKLNQSNLSVKVMMINYDDITADETNEGRVLIYPKLNDNFIPLINKKPLPSFINCNVNLDKNMFLSFGIITTENKNIEKSLLDYFNEKNISQIKIEYQIDYGNTDIGYNSLVLSNNVSKYSPIKLLLDYPENSIIDIIVTMRVKIDDKLLERQTSLTNVNTSFMEKLSSINDLPLNHFVVEHVENETINHTIIKESKEKDFIVIDRPIYIKDIQSDNININENRLIRFDNIDENSKLLLIAENNIEYILNPHITADNVYYFDTSLIVVSEKVNNYQLVDSLNHRIIKSGKIEH